MLPSTFRQLEVFLAVVEAGGIAGGAERLSVSAATVSNHIKALETQMGCPLFNRERGRRVTLTEAGRRVHFRAKELMRQAELLARELQPRRATDRPRLTVVAQRFLARSFLSGSIATFTEEHPGVELILETERIEGVLAAIQAGRADIGYLIANDDRMEIPSRVVGRERLGFFAAPDHEAAQRMPLTVEALARYPFILTRADERFGHVILVAMERFGLTRFTTASQIQDGSTIGEMVSRGKGLMCGPARYLADLVNAGRLVELQLDAEPMYVSIHEIRAPGYKSAADAFAALLPSLSALTLTD